MMDKSQKFWNRLSKNYDKKAKDKVFDELLLRSPIYLQPKDTVLDFACATGLYSIEFAPYVKELYAFDTSFDMIAIAKRNTAKRGIENITFNQTTLFDKRYEKGSFDVIFALNILLYFEDLDQVLQRMHHLLKPGGLIITSTACLSEKKAFLGIVSGAIIYLLKKLGSLPYLKFLKIHELEDAISRAEFTLIESDTLLIKPAVEHFIVAQKANTP